jgi:hypothetical protein
MKNLSKILYLLSAILIALWVVPNFLKYSKNRDIYYKKLDSLERLDKREIPYDAKRFHAELFKEDMKRYFENIEDIDIKVTSLSNGKYEIKVLFPKKYLPNFLNALRDTPLNYRVYLDRDIVYKQSNKIIEATFIVTPY